ncbi:MAG TPA: hypothetical protein DEF45_12950 [Rhodopirellula sp.]|nr:hypothetical protein [Rhodopirellula sp.]
MFRFHVVCSDEEKRADAGSVPPIHFLTSGSKRAQYHEIRLPPNLRQQLNQHFGTHALHVTDKHAVYL